MLQTHQDFRNHYTDKSRSRHVLAADTSTELANFIVPKSSQHTLYIQRIVVAPTTYAAQTLTFRDGAGTPVPIGHVSVPGTAPTTGIASYEIDFGPAGVPLTQGEELNIIASAAGIAGRVSVEAYEKLTGVRSHLDGATVQ